jgi:hypothetical protein
MAAEFSMRRFIEQLLEIGLHATIMIPLCVSLPMGASPHFSPGVVEY